MAAERLAAGLHRAGGEGHDDRERDGGDRADVWAGVRGEAFVILAKYSAYGYSSDVTRLENQRVLNAHQDQKLAKLQGR